MCNIDKLQIHDGYVEAKITMAPGCVTADSPANFIAAVKAELGLWFELGEGTFTTDAHDDGGPTWYTVMIGVTNPRAHIGLLPWQKIIRGVERRFNSAANTFPAPRADVFAQAAF